MYVVIFQYARTEQLRRAFGPFNTLDEAELYIATCYEPDWPKYHIYKLVS